MTARLSSQLELQYFVYCYQPQTDIMNNIMNCVMFLGLTQQQTLSSVAAANCNLMFLYLHLYTCTYYTYYILMHLKCSFNDSLAG